MPIWPPFLIGRNSGPADRLATCCHSCRARTGQVLRCSPRGRPMDAPFPSGSVFERPSRIYSPSRVAVMSLTLRPTSSDRRRAAAKPISSMARSRRPPGPEVAGLEQALQQLERQGSRLLWRRPCSRSAPRNGSCRPTANTAHPQMLCPLQLLERLCHQRVFTGLKTYGTCLPKRKLNLTNQ